jgi:hypothetical protein
MVRDSPKKNNFNEKGPLPIDKNKENEKREKRKEHDRKAAKIRRQKNKQANKERGMALDRVTAKNEQLKEKIEKLKLVRSQLKISWATLKLESEIEWITKLNSIDVGVNSEYGINFTEINSSSPIMSETIYIVNEEEIIATSECKALILFMLIEPKSFKSTRINKFKFLLILLNIYDRSLTKKINKISKYNFYLKNLKPINVNCHKNHKSAIV